MSFRIVTFLVEHISADLCGFNSVFLDVFVGLADSMTSPLASALCYGSSFRSCTIVPDCSSLSSFVGVRLTSAILYATF